MRVLTYHEVRCQARVVADRILAQGIGTTGRRVYGVPRGGIIPAYMVAADLGSVVVFDPAHADIIVDDIFDSGATKLRHVRQYPGIPFYTLFDKRETPWAGEWLVMPWEDQSVGGPEDAVTRLIQYIGEDPAREGLKDTPARVVKAWAEWGAGYKQDPGAVLKVFEDGAQAYDEMVVVRDIPLVSTCEHHLAPFMGSAHVGYVPDGRVVGLSKLARLVEVFARRLQVQERLTAQIADALMDHVQPLGAAVMIRAEHTCMSTRGVKVHGAATVTSALRGCIKDKPEARAEFMELCR